MITRQFYVTAVLVTALFAARPSAAQDATADEGSSESILSNAQVFDSPQSSKKVPKTATKSGKTPVMSAEAAAAYADIYFVNNLGDPERLVFKGASHFSTRQLRRQLALDLAYQAAARLTNTTSAFIETLEQRLEAGYQRSGCPDASVSANRDSQRKAIVVQLDEGPRYVMGEVVVEGATSLDKETITNWLTSPQKSRTWKYERGSKLIELATEDSDGDPITLWTPGELVDFRNATTKRLQQAAAGAFVDLGFADASFKFDVKKNVEAGTADLVVQISDETSQYVVGEIEIGGLKRDTREALIEYLGIRSGDPIDAAYLQRISDRLSESCRYWNKTIFVQFPQVERQDGDTSPRLATLRIELEEYGKAPGLNKPLLPTQETLRKTALWIRSLKSRDADDLVCTMTSANVGLSAGTAQVAIKSDGTLAVKLRRTSTNGLRIDHTFLALPQAGEIYDWQHADKLCLDIEWRPKITVRIAPSPPKEDDDGKQHALMSLNYAFCPSGSEDSSINAFSRVQIEPAAFVHLADLPDIKAESNDGALTLTTDEFELEIDEQTGAIKRIEAASFLAAGIAALQFKTEPGAVDRMVAEAHERGANFTNRFDEEKPVVSFCDYVLQQCRRQPVVKRSAAAKRLCALAQAILNNTESQEAAANMLGWFDPKSKAEDELPFIIPGVPIEDLSATSTWPYWIYAPVAADKLFPRGSLPWTLIRETSFAQLSNGPTGESWDTFRENTSRELKSLDHENEFGPIGRLLFAKTFKAALARGKPNGGSSNIASKGLNDLSDDAFLKDIRLLADGDRGFAVLCRVLTTEIGKIPADEVPELLSLAPAPLQWPLECIAERRQEHPNEPPAESLNRALLQVWHNGLRDLVEAELRSIAREANETAKATKASSKR